MARTADELYEEAMALPAVERERLIEMLYDLEFPMTPDRAEIERRIAEIDAGTAELVSVEDALASARAALDARTTSSRR
jgi:putative addiction module component (TIGR02574 family)